MAIVHVSAILKIVTPLLKTVIEVWKVPSKAIAFMVWTYKILLQSKRKLKVARLL